MLKMVTISRGDAENGHCQSRWCWKWSLSVEVMMKMVIISRGGDENCHRQSRWSWKSSLSVEVMLKIVTYQDSRYRINFVPTDLKILKFGPRFKIKICIWTLRINPNDKRMMKCECLYARSKPRMATLSTRAKSSAISLVSCMAGAMTPLMVARVAQNIIL